MKEMNKLEKKLKTMKDKRKRKWIKSNKHFQIRKKKNKLKKNSIYKKLLKK